MELFVYINFSVELSLIKKMKMSSANFDRYRSQGKIIKRNQDKRHRDDSLRTESRRTLVYIGSCGIEREYVQLHRCLQRTVTRKIRMVQCEMTCI